MRLGLTAAAAVLLVTSACGSSDDEEGPLAVGGDPTPSASASPAAQAPTPPEAGNDKQGRHAFARYVVEALSYAYATNDPGPINEVAADTATQQCQMCATFTDHLAEQKSRGQSLVGSRYPVASILDTGEVAPGIWVVDVVSDTPAYREVDADGKTLRRYPAQKGYVVEIGMTFNKGSYQLTGWKAGEQ